MSEFNPSPQVARVEADPKRPWKAIAATALAFVGAFVAHWVADVDPYTAKDAGQGFLVGLSAALPGGLAAYAVRNPLVAKEVR